VVGQKEGKVPREKSGESQTGVLGTICHKEYSGPKGGKGRDNPKEREGGAFRMKHNNDPREMLKKRDRTFIWGGNFEKRVPGSNTIEGAKGVVEREELGAGPKGGVNRQKERS